MTCIKLLKTASNLRKNFKFNATEQKYYATQLILGSVTYFKFLLEKKVVTKWEKTNLLDGDASWSVF